MNSRQDIYAFSSYFANRSVFTTDEIVSYFQAQDSEINRNTINWRIYSLAKQGIIQRLKKGCFSLSVKQTFTPTIEKELLRLNKLIRHQFPFIETCIWNMSILNLFSQHLSNKAIVLVEVEKDVAEQVFLFLRETKNNVYLNPSTELLQNYVFQTDKMVYIVKNLISEAPITKVAEYNTISLEKLLVDLFCDKTIFEAYQGRELHYIYSNIFNQFSINTAKLLRYATRRGKKNEFEKTLNQILGNNLK